MKNKTIKIKWLNEPEEHDYSAAESYLSLLYHETEVKNKIDTLKKIEIRNFKAKDIFRASSLSLLGVSNHHIEKDIKKIKNGLKISPILLVRELELKKLIVADGYHRLCAVYSFDEDALIPCKII